MYESHFGLCHRPFRPIPDNESYYPATSHEQALARVLGELRDEEGLALLTGEPGTGKTLLGYCLLDRIGEEAETAFLLNSHFRDAHGLLQAILFDLTLPHQGPEHELRLALTDHLIKGYEAGRRTVLVIDEAQHLTIEILEELRMLGNLEGRQGKAIQVVLLGLPSVGELLGQGALASFQQRLATRVGLLPLDYHESADYLVHRLRWAGGKPERIITDEALEILARGGKGIPRLLNRLAHQALMLAFGNEATQVDAEAALGALEARGLSGDENQGETGEAGLNSTIEPTLETETSGDSVLVLESPVSVEKEVPSRRLFASPRRPA